MEEKPKNAGSPSQALASVRRLIAVPLSASRTLWIAALVIGVVVVISFTFGVFNGIQDFFARLNPPTTAQVDLSDTIVNAVTSRGTLVTAESHQSNRDLRVSVTRWLLNSGGYGASHFAEGTIFAGVDLESDLVQATKQTGTAYRLMLPAAGITSCSLKPLTQYDRSTTAVGDWEAVLDLASYTAMNDFVRTAIDGGVLDEAERSAKRVIGDLLRTVVEPGVVIDIEFHPREIVRIDDTCEPHVPRDWVYDAAQGTWSKK